jgi:hypothetical protein
MGTDVAAAGSRLALGQDKGVLNVQGKEARMSEMHPRRVGFF